MFKLDHIVLQVNNFPSALQFYRDLFEFTQFTEVPDLQSDKSVGFRQSDGLTIWVDAHEGDQIQAKKGSLNHYAFHCENTTEVDRAFAFCQARGWKILSAPQAYPEYGNFYGFAFEGPDGLKLEFVTR